MPGKPASTRLTWVFGSAPNAVAAPENSFDFEITWAWTSRPRMTSHLPVLPSIKFFSSTAISRISEALRLRGEVGGALDGAAGAQHGLFVKGTAAQLQPERQAAVVQAGRHRDTRQAGEVHGHGEDVVQIHRHGVVELLLETEGGAGCRRRQHDIDVLEGVGEVLEDEGADPLGPEIIGVVITGGEHIGADHDTAL